MRVPHCRLTDLWESSWVLSPKSVIFNLLGSCGSQTNMFSKVSDEETCKVSSLGG